MKNIIFIISLFVTLLIGCEKYPVTTCYNVYTLDSSFIVIKKPNSVRFDSITLDTVITRKAYICIENIPEPYSYRIDSVSLNNDTTFRNIYYRTYIKQ
jgi:hypothetical protein